MNNLSETRHVLVLRDMLGGVPADELHSDQRRAIDAAIEALAAPAEGAQRYSDDRLSLAQEVRDALKVRGHWTPDNWAGPDLITAVAMAITQKPAEGAQGEAIGEMRDGGVTWFKDNPHAFPVGTKFYTTPPAASVE